jgi:hypothetical protein
VIVDLVGHDSDTSSSGTRPLDTPAVADAFPTIAELVRGTFEGRAVIVSKAGPRVSARTLEWLRHHRFHELTGIAPADVHFVRAVPNRGEVCRRVGVTHFVDDRVDVLAALTTVSNRYLFSAAWAPSVALPRRRRSMSSAPTPGRSWPARSG